MLRAELQSVDHFIFTRRVEHANDTNSMHGTAEMSAPGNGEGDANIGTVHDNGLHKPLPDMLNQALAAVRRLLGQRTVCITCQNFLCNAQEVAA